MEKLTRLEARQLGVDAYFGKSSISKYTAEERKDGLQRYLEDLNKDFKRNKLDIYEIIEETVNAVLPIKVRDYVKNFAEYKTYGENVEIVFHNTNGKIKAVEVALGGHVERQRIDKGSFTIKATALQAKVYEEYERVIGGQVDWNALINRVIDAIMEGILTKVYNSLMAIYSSLPNANKHQNATLDKAEFDKIISTVKAYSGKAIIMGTSLALSKIVLDQYASELDKEDIRNKGYLGLYKGCAVVEIPQSFEDESNTTKIFDEDFLFVLPSANEKLVLVALQGGIKTKDSEGADWTYNFEAYQKVGVAIKQVQHVGMYKFV